MLYHQTRQQQQIKNQNSSFDNQHCNANAKWQICMLRTLSIDNTYWYPFQNVQNIRIPKTPLTFCNQFHNSWLEDMYATTSHSRCGYDKNRDVFQRRRISYKLCGIMDWQQKH